MAISVIRTPVSDASISAVNDDIRIIILSNFFGPVNGLFLLVINSCIPLIAFTAHRPALSMRHYVLMSLVVRALTEYALP